MLRPAQLAAGIAAIVLVAGCSPPRPSSPADGVDVAALDPCHYPAKPYPPLGKAGHTIKGGWAEARRMGNNVVGPWEVDPALTDVHCCISGVVKDSAAVNEVLARPFGDAVAKHNFLAGFASANRSDLIRSPAIMDLTNLVLRFASEADAAAAAAEMKNQSLTVTPKLGGPRPTHPIPIPRYPQSTAVADTSDKLKAIVYAFTPHGPFVLCQQAASDDGPDAAAQLSAATLDKQLPLINQFTPTPRDQLAELPLDPNGLLARSLQGPDVYFTNGIYQPRADLHIDPRLTDPAKESALFNAVGLQQVAWAGTTVYETRDASAASRLVDDFAAAKVADKYRPTTGIAGMPNAKCLAKAPQSPQSSSIPGISIPEVNSIPGWVCFATAGRFAIAMFDEKETDVHQRVTAQYLMLTAQ